MDINETRNGTRINFSKELEELLAKYPLNYNFIDWAAAKGVTINYIPNPYKQPNDWYGKLEDRCNGSQRILINKDMQEKQKDMTLIHELIHLAVPLIPFNNEFESENDGTIDRIAVSYVENKDFMGYIKKTIKIQTF